jgi:uncharacterized protein YqgV (UPF0045/DUF77 family)
VHCARSERRKIVIAEIQCLARPPGTTDDPYRHVEAAIAVIQQSGLKYEVGALGTTVEGEPDQLWPLLRRIHEACLESGTDGLVSVIKVGQSADPARQSTIESLTGKFR